MFFINDEERDDQDRDDEEDDADIDNSEDEEEDDDADDESDDDDSDDEDDDDDEDDKDKSKKSKKAKSDDRDSNDKSKKNRDAAARRKSSDKRDYKEQKAIDARLENLEKAEKQRLLLERKRTFGYENGLSPKQVDYVFRNTKRPTPKFLNQPEIRAGLDAIKRTESVPQNTARNNGNVFKDKKGKEVPYTQLPADEKQSRFADRRRAILESKRG